MAIKRVDTVERFAATDEDGNGYQVIIRQEIIDARTNQNPYGEVPGLKSAKLSDGRQLRYINADTFEIFQTETIIKRA
jgi:hypothetical protein